MAPFQKDKLPASIGATQLVNSKWFNLSYLGGGRFLYSLHFREGLRFGRFDLYTPRKMGTAGAVAILYTSFLLFNSSTTPAQNINPGVGGDDNGENAIALSGMTEDEAFQSGDQIRKNIMSGDDEPAEAEHEVLAAEDIVERPQTTNFIDELDVNPIEIEPVGPHTLKKKFKTLKVTSYTIKKGDYIGRVAKNFGVTKATIATAARVSLDDPLPVGKTIKVPNYTGYFIKSKKGDSIAKIAQRYKLKYEKFIALNNLESIDRLPPGARLFLPDKKQPGLTQSWLLPTRSRVINSGFGWRRYPRRAFHEGIDLRSRYESVRASKSGTVIYSGWMGAYGKAVVIKHAAGYKTLYAHNSRLYVRRGQKVKRGQNIARSGNTGYSFGPHVHFEISRYGKHLNPARFFRGLRWKKSRKKKRRRKR